MGHTSKKKELPLIVLLYKGIYTDIKKKIVDQFNRVIKEAGK